MTLRPRRTRRKRGAYDRRFKTPVADPVALALADARIAAGLTQAELAERIGITLVSIKKMERAVNRIPWRLLEPLRDHLPAAQDWPARIGNPGNRHRHGVIVFPPPTEQAT